MVDHKKLQLIIFIDRKHIPEILLELSTVLPADTLEILSEAHQTIQTTGMLIQNQVLELRKLVAKA